MESQELKRKSEDEKQDESEEKRGEDDIMLECIHCGNQPCVVTELEPMFTSILQTYGDIKSNKQIRFQMYSDTIRYIHGPGLGKGVRKKPPHCVVKTIHSMAPSDKYTGFIDNSNCK